MYRHRPTLTGLNISLGRKLRDLDAHGLYSSLHCVRMINLRRRIALVVHCTLTGWKIHKHFGWNPERRGPLARRRCKSQDSIKCDSNKENLRMWTRLICLRIDANGGRWWQFNMAITVWDTEQLMTGPTDWRQVVWMSLLTRILRGHWLQCLFTVTIWRLNFL
jgi:hypothetical protein